MSIVGSRGQLFFLRLDSFEHATVSVVQLNQVRRQRRALDSRKTRKFCLSHKEARTAARNLPNHGIGCSTVAGPCYSDTAGNGTFIGEIPRVASCAGHMESGQDGTGTKPLLSRDSAESAVWGPPCFHMRTSLIGRRADLCTSGRLRTAQLLSIGLASYHIVK